MNNEMVGLECWVNAKRKEGVGGVEGMNHLSFIARRVVGAGKPSIQILKTLKIAPLAFD